MSFKTKLALILLVVIFVSTALGSWLWLRNYADKSIVDEAGVMADAEPYHIRTYFLKEYSDVHFRIVTKKSLNGLSIDQAADREFARQRRWSSMNPDRAALFFLALEEQAVCLRLGDRLTPALNDKYFGKPLLDYVQTNMAGSFDFDRGQQWQILSWTLDTVLLSISKLYPLPPRVAMEGELPPFAKHIVRDDAGIVRHPIITLRNLLMLRTMHQIDFRIVTMRTLAGKDINVVAAKTFKDLGVGRDTPGERGLLLLIAPEDQLVRLEVGYELEDVFPDGFVGYIEREQMAPYFKSGRVFLGVTETIVTILERGAEKFAYAQFTPESSSEADSPLSGGGGAKMETRVSTERTKPEIVFLPDSVKEEFKACMTPAETFATLLRAWQRHINDPTLDIYTKESQIFLSNEVISKLELVRIAETYAGEPFEEKLKGNRAVLKFEKYPPVFLKKGSQGWQIDLATMDRAMRFKVTPHSVFGGIMCISHPYRFAYPHFSYVKGEKPPEFLTKGVDENTPWLGVTFGFTRDTDFKELELIAGSFVLEVCPESPADKAGLQYGDIIITINRWKGTHSALIPKIIRFGNIGDTMDIIFYREHKPYQTQAVLGPTQNADYL